MADRVILIGRQAIMEYIGISSVSLFQELLGCGMPARSINNRWYAHVENIDIFFKKYTNVRVKKPAMDSE